MPGHQHKIVLCSDTGYPRYKHPLLVPLYSGMDTVPEFWGESLKKSVFTLVPRGKRARAPSVNMALLSSAFSTKGGLVYGND